jgi:23S rRNA pseudouridine1911/1915/1917 synthase
MKVKVETGGVRLDKALSELTELSRSVANDQIKAGQVLVNGQVKKAKYTVQEGDTITFKYQKLKKLIMSLKIFLEVY